MCWPGNSGDIVPGKWDFVSQQSHVGEREQDKHSEN